MQKKPPKKNVKQPRGFFGRIFRVVGWMIAALSFVGTVVGLYVEVVPVVSVSPPSSGSSSQDPFTKPFVVNNEDSFSVYSVKATCGFPAGIEGVTKSGGTTLEPGKPAGAEADFRFDSFSTDELESQEHRPFTCGTISNITLSGQFGSLSRCWVTIIVEFKPIKFIPRFSSHKFSFEAGPQEDGYFHWSEIPLGPG